MARPCARILGVWLGVAGASAKFATAAPGAVDVAAIHLEYAAPSSCPSRAEFLAQLRERVASLSEAGEGEPAPRFRIDVHPGADGIDTIVHTKLPDGAESHRVFRTNDCGEAIQAAALVVALVLPVERESPAPPESGARVEPARDPPEDRKPSKPPEAASHTSPFRLGIGAQLGWPATVLGTEPGGGGYVQATLFAKDLFSPSLRAAILFQQGTFTTERGNAELSLVFGRLSACPVRLPVSSAFQVRPCLLGELGRLRGKGEDTDEPRTSDVTWFALGTSIRGAWSVLDVISLEAEGAVVLPLVRDRFVFDPAPTRIAFAIEGLHGSALLGMGAEWP